MKTFLLGNSTQGKAIEGFATSETARVLVMSGLHGDEVEGRILTALLIRRLIESNEQDILSKLYILSNANPDGVFTHNRWNAREVDLNRNWPTKDWIATYSNPRYPPGEAAGSERETQVLKSLMEERKFELVLDLHSYKESVVLPLLAHSTEYLDGQIELMGNAMGIPVIYEQNDLGYSIAGGFHTWCFENGINNITLEVEKGLGQFAIEDKYLDPVIRFLKSL